MWAARHLKLHGQAVTQRLHLRLRLKGPRSARALHHDHGHSRIPNQPPTSCDAVIIGGGAIGCSTLYHLTKLGMRNVVLLEQAKLTAGTTWHTAGLVWSLRPSDTDIQLLQVTRDLVQRLESETGLYSGWNQNGGLFLASTKERLDEYKRLHTLGKAFGINSTVLSPAETAARFPVLDPSTLYGTLLSEGDGNLDPSSYCAALTKFATAAGHGATVLEGPAFGVEAVRTKESTYKNHRHRRVVGVETVGGAFIETPVVISCTGVWAGHVARSAGIHSLPLVAMKHSYVVFDQIDAVKGMPNIRDHDEGVYYRIQSDSLCIGGYEPNPVILNESPPRDFAFGLYELDWDVFGRHIDGAIKRMPMLKEVGVKSTICGPESFTPDHKPLLGPDPVIEGFFHGCGFNSAGMMFSGGAGQQLAAWVVDGQPDLDMYAFDVRRFSPKVTASASWVRERSHEAYAKNYSIVFKHDEPLAGRNQLLTPFHEKLQAKGCMFQERQGWERAGFFDIDADGRSRLVPVQPYDWYGQYGYEPNADRAYVDALQRECSFEHPLTAAVHTAVRQECIHTRRAVSVFDMSYFGKFFLTGPDALDAAQYLFTAQMAGRPLGSTVYTCFLNENGDTQADFTATILDQHRRLPQDPHFEGLGFYLAVGGTTAHYTYAGLKDIIRKKRWDVDLVDCSEDYGMLSVQGPRSRALLSRVFDDLDLRDAAFPFSTSQIGFFGPDWLPVRLLRVSFVGELGWELHVPREHCSAVYEQLMEAGAKFGLRDAGYRAIDSLSIEKGYRHWHADLRSDDSPLEAGLGFTCSNLNTNVDFVGRQALEGQQQRAAVEGLPKRLMCFTLDGNENQRRTPLWGFETVWTEAEGAGLALVGFLRTADYSFMLERSIGWGYVEREKFMAADGVTARGPNKNWWRGLEARRWWVEVMGQRIPAKVHLRSPFDPQNKRVRGKYEEPELRVGAAWTPGGQP